MKNSPASISKECTFLGNWKFYLTTGLSSGCFVGNIGLENPCWSETFLNVNKYYLALQELNTRFQILTFLSCKQKINNTSWHTSNLCKN